MIGVYILVSIIGALWAGAVASQKNNNVIGFAIAGLLFPLLGVLAAYIASPTPDERPWDPGSSRAR